MTQIQKIIMTPKLVVGKANPPATNWEQRIDAAYDKYSKALDKVTVKTAKKRDGMAGFEKRIAKHKTRLDAALAEIRSDAGLVDVRKKKKKPVVVEQDDYETEDEPQPSQIGPQAHRNPAAYPTEKSASMDKREKLLQVAADEYCAATISKSKGSTNGDLFAANRSEYQNYVKGLYSGRVKPAAYSAAPLPVDFGDDYAALMKRADGIADRTGRTVEQEFSALYEKRAKAPLVPGNNEDETDDGDLPEDAGDGDFDDDDAADDTDLRGDRGEPPGAASGGSSSGTYSPLWRKRNGKLRRRRRWPTTEIL